ncbi:hypothetical protein ACNF40_02550 [Cuniculiplasma sp. SKW4]|uniref:hypothetical protein n=1 Tax=Cuniculiplasma sp. SKW4 TaxID=3400171 RepID=UPI003FD2A436
MFLRSENALKIGIILLVVSVVVFSVSIFGIYNTINSFTNQDSTNSSPLIFSINTSAGEPLSYTVEVRSNTSNNFTTYLKSPNGEKFLEANFTGSGVSKSMVATQSGEWHLYVLNRGNKSSSISVHLGTLPYYLEAGAYLGLTVLVIGIILLIYHFDMGRRERNRQSEKYR